MQLGESSKMNCGLHGVRTERPYPPFSRKLSSNFRTSNKSRSSFCMSASIFHTDYSRLEAAWPYPPSPTNVTRVTGNTGEMMETAHTPHRIGDSIAIELDRE